MTGFLQDLRYAVRQLRKSPGFTAAAVLTLALGVGANTALFSIVNGILLNPLPFSQPDQLIALGENKPNFTNGSISYPNFRDWQKDNHTFSSLALSRVYAFGLTGRGEAEQVSGDFISSDFFSLLGVQPSMGHTFTVEEERPGGAPLALISAGLWERKFGSAPDILGKNITLDAMDYTIVGVIPASFHLRLPSFSDEQVYLPIGQWKNPLLLQRGAGLGFHGIGRLKAGVTIEQARADMDRVTQNLASAYPDADKGITANLVPLKQQMVGSVKPLLLVLLSAVGFVLLIACVNVANLMLARSTARNHEFAIRTALGAGQGRLIRQLLTESILLALTGGAFGLLLAATGTRAALGILPSALPRAEEIGLDLKVLIFTTAISLMAGILFGLAPALKMSRPGLNKTLNEGGRGGSGARHRAQSVFVMTEMATAVVLLIGAGLMVRSLTQLWNVDPGFNSHQVLSFGLSLPPSMNTASPAAIRAYFRDFDNQLAAVRGIEQVSQTWGALPMGADDEQLFWREGQPQPSNDNQMDWAIDYIVEPDYLKVMRIPLQHGRFFTPHDDEHSPLVVAVDEIFAHKYFPGQDPVGKRIHLKTSDQLAEIVGVVGHVKQWGLDADDAHPLRAQFYIPCMQMPDAFVKMTPSGSAVVLKSTAPTSELLASIRQVNRQMSNQQIIYSVQTMDELVSSSLATQRFSMVLLGAFAVLALILASIGIYGVVSYVAGRRTREIGIRMAMGAQRRDILRLILGNGGKLTLIGVVIGLISAMALTRLMKGLLYEVHATDPLTFFVVAVLLTLVALAACYIPARRAAKVDPIVALRYE